MASAYERLQQRKKNNTTKLSSEENSNSTAYERLQKRKKTKEYESTINFDTFESDLNSLGKTVTKIRDEWQTEETMANTRSSIESMQKRIGAYQEYRNLYGGEKDSDWADLSDISKTYDEILGEWDDLSNSYRRHKSADSYEKALKEGETAKANRKKQETEDIDALQLDIDEWQSKYDSAKKEHDEWEIPIGVDEAKTKSTGVITYYPAEAKTAAEKARDEAIKKKYGYSLEELEKTVGEKTAYLNQTKYIQGNIKLTNDAKNADNFDEYATEGLTLEENTFGSTKRKKIGGKGRPVGVKDDYRLAAEAMSQFAKGEEISDENIFKNATEDEFKTFAYWRKYDQVKGTNKAYEYVDSIKETINQREGANIGEEYEAKSDFAKILYGAEAGLDQFASGFANALNTTDKYIPTTSTQYASQNIRDQLWDSGANLPEWLGGTSLGQVAYDAVNTTANMVPSLAAGAVSNALVPGSGTYVTAGLMGLSASGNAYQQMLNQGYDKGQSRTYATLVGLSEATLSAALSGMIGGKVTEKAIENVIKGIDKGFLRFAARWGMSGLSEIPEESLQTLLEPIIQNIALGYEKNKLEDTDWSQVAYDGLLGGISGLGLGGVTSATNTISEQSTWKTAGKGVKSGEQTDKMLEVAGLTPQESDAHNLYTRYSNKGINADNISDVQLGRLYTTTKDDATSTIKSKNTSIEQKLSAGETLGKLGEIDSASAVAKKRSKLNVGEETKVTESGASVDVKGIKLGATPTLITSEGEVSAEEVTLSDRDADLVARAQLMPEEVANLYLSQAEGHTDIEAYTNSFNLVSAYAENNFDQNTILERKGVLSTDQVKAIYNATVKAQFDAKQKKLDEISAKQGKTMFVQGTLNDSIIDYNSKTTDGSKVNWNSLTSRQRAAIKFVKMFTKATGVNVTFIKSEVVDGKHKGKNGSYNAENNTIEIDVYAGRIDAGTVKDTIIPTLSHEMTHWMKAKAISSYENIRNDILKTLSEKSGISSEALISQEMNRLKKAHKDMDVTPEKAIDEIVARACADMLSDSKKARELLNKMSANEQQGFIEKVKETFENLMNWIEKLIAEYKNEDTSGEAKLLREYKEDLQRIQAQWDNMLVEAVNMNQALQNEGVKGEQVIGELAKANELQFNERLVETHFDKIRQNYSEDAAIDVDTLLGRYEKIVDIWKRLGGELNSKFLEDWNNKEGKDRAFSVFKAQAGYKYNVELSSMCKKGIPLFEAIDKIVKQEVMKELNTKTLGKAEKEILYDILKEKNFEIPCAICYVEQARQREGVIIDAFLNGKIEKTKTGKITQYKLGWNETLAEVQKEMKAAGCDYTFPALDRSVATDNYTPQNVSMDEETQEYFFEALKKVANNEISRYNKEAKNKKKLITKTDPASLKAVFKGKLPLNLAMFKTMFEDSSSRFTIADDLLYSSMTTQNLAATHYGLYSIFNSQGGVGGYKTKQGTIVYWGDILKKTWKPDTLRKEGGVRNQSNSDFLMFTLLDHAQMYIDFTAKGYYLQAYTKVLAELKLFGLSKGKINASLIPKVHEYRNADGSVDVEKTRLNAGLDENGNLIFDDFEGINHTEAFMLLEDAEYSKSIGGVCIGYSDNHIQKLLDDNRIQLIIGFHDKTNDPDKRYRGAKYSKNYNGLNEATYYDKEGNLKTKHIGFNQFVIKAEGKFKNGKESYTHNGKTYKYNDIPKLATDLYLEHCESKGLFPAYSQGGIDFSKHENYYKLLADFSMYDINGNYVPHQKVEFNMPDQVPFLDKNGNKAYEKTEDYIKRELGKELKVRDSISEKLADTSEDGIIPEFKKRVNELYSEKQYEDREDNTNEDIKFDDRDYDYWLDKIDTISDKDALKIRSEKPYLRVANTTPTILQKYGALNLPLIIRFDAMYLAQRGSGAFEGHYHHLGKSVMENLLDYVSNPDAILKTVTKNKNSKEVIKLIALVSIPIKSGEALASIEINTVKDSGEGNELYNLVVTFFDYKENYLRNLFVKYGAEIKYKKETLSQDNPKLHKWFGTIKESVSKDIIRNPNEKVNENISNYSDRDSEGNTLTKEQIEFFKDSKIRDKNGNLLVVRHGTNEDFHIFDFSKAGRNGKAEGAGFYFSDEKEITKRYGDIQKEVYLNITKPIYNNKRTVKKAELVTFVNALIDFDLEKWGGVWQDSFISNYINTYEFQMSRRYAVQQFVNQIWDYNENDQDLIFEVAQADGRTYENSTMKEFYDVLTKSIGYDGIIAEWSHSEGKSNVYVTFNSEQSKYTSNQNPTANPDLRYEDREISYGKLTQNRIDYLIEDSGAGSRVDYANMWVASINPSDFIDLTLSSKTRNKGREIFDTEVEGDFGSVMGDRDYISDLKKSREMPYLSIDMDSGKVTGHNGRHRMRALEKAGATRTPIGIKFYKDGKLYKGDSNGVRLEAIDLMRLTSQFDDKFYLQLNAYIHDIIPLNEDHRSEIEKKYLAKPFETRDGWAVAYEDRETESIYDKMGETDRIAEENKKLKADVERLIGVIGDEKVDLRRFRSLADFLKKRTGNDVNREELGDMLKEAYTFIQSGENVEWQDVMVKANEIATFLMNRDLKVPVNYFKEVMSKVRKDTFTLSAEQRAKAEEMFGGYSNFHKAMFGRVNITTNEGGMSLEERWENWSKLYPSIFDANVKGADQIEALADIVDTLKATSSLMGEFEREEAIRHLTNEVYNQFWNIAADSNDAAKESRAKHREMMEQMRKDYEQRQKERTLHPVGETALKYDALYKKMLKRKKEEISEAKKLGKERLDTYKENAERKTKIQSITSNALTLNKWLTNPDKEKHINKALRGPVINLLQAIDFSSKQLLGMKGSSNKGTPTKKDISLQGALSEVKDMMADASVGKAELIELYGHGLDDDIKSLVTSVDNMMRTVGDNEFILNQMTLEELATLDKIVRTIKSAVSKMNKFHTVHHAQGIAHLSQEEIEYADSLGKTKVFDPQSLKGKLQKLINWDNKNPFYAFKQFGEAGKKIFEAFQDGWDKLAFNAKKIIDFAKETYTNKEVTEWTKEIKTFDVLVPATNMDLYDPNYKPKKQKVQMTVPQIMSLYCLMKREQAKSHILGGGIRVADIKMKNKELIQQSEGALLTEGDINNIINTLTPRQKAVADALQNFMNTVCAAWGNAVSMARFGYEAFGEENYFPIKSDDNNLQGEETPQEEINSLFKLLNMSFTKTTIQGANNRIVISDIFDVFASHSSDMAKYNALALPVLDANRWYNYTEKIETEDTQFFTKSVKQSIENAFGKEGKKYITTFLQDINGQKNVGRDTLGKDFFSRAKIVSVAANLRVALLQPTAYLKASAVIDNRYLTQALLHKPKTNKAIEHCGIALWKSLGYYDTDISRGLTEKIKHDESWKDKVVEFSLKGAEWGDKITFGYLWNACELEIRKTRKDLKVGSEEFYDTIAKRLREVIYATQVVDSTMTRSQIMRSGNMYEKMLTAFSSEPTLAFNMLQDAFVTAKLDSKRYGKAEAWKRNGKNIARVVYAYTITNVVAAMIESGFDVLRDDDDEEEENVPKFMQYYLTNFSSDMSIIGKIPYIKEIVSIAQGFSSSRSDTQWMQIFSNVISNAVKISQGKGNPTNLIKDAIRTISFMSGLPFYNAYRDMMATLNKLDILTAEELEEMLSDIFG